MKRKSSEAKSHESQPKKTRSKVPKFDKNKCFVPGCTIKDEEEILHDVLSKKLDGRFRLYAEILSEEELAGGN